MVLDIGGTHGGCGYFENAANNRFLQEVARFLPMLLSPWLFC